MTQLVKFSGDLEVIFNTVVARAVKTTHRVVVEAATIVFASSHFVRLTKCEAHAGTQVLVGTWSGSWFVVTA